MQSTPTLLATLALVSSTASATFAQCEVNLLYADDALTDDNFGNAVAISEEWAIVGAPFADAAGTDSGAAYVFRRGPDGRWNQIQKLAPAGLGAGDRFGTSIAISDGIAIVGAYRDDDMGADAGAAYVFQLGPQQWDLVTKLVAESGQPFDWFGYTVGLDGPLAVVGALLRDGQGAGSGSACIYRQVDGQTWALTTEVSPADGETGDLFGTSVALFDDRVVIGAIGDDDGGENAGAAYVYELGQGGWTQTAKLVAEDPSEQASLGFAVAMTENSALVGAFRDSEMGADAGSAYVFRRTNDGSWVQGSKLLADSPGPDQNFGSAIDIDGQRAVVGARGEGAGRISVFQVGQSGWEQVLAFEQTISAEGDSFGFSVAIDGAHGLGGAIEHDAGAPDAGAVSAYLLDSGDALQACPRMLSLSAGGQADMSIRTAAALAGATYLVIGSMSGTGPGIPSGGFLVPLVPDVYTSCTLDAPNTPPLAGSLGVLDPQGNAQASFLLPTGMDPALVGAQFHHAFVVIGADSFLDGVSNPIAIEIVP